MHLPPCSHPVQVGAAVLVVAVTTGFLGCTTATKYAVNVDAVSNPIGVDGWSYTMAAASPNRASSDSRYAEVETRVHVALSQRGLYEAPNPADADFVIAFEYGERAPQTRVNTVTQPVVVQPDPFGTGATIGGPSIGTGANPYGRQPYGANSPQVVMVQTAEVIRTSEKYLHISARENPAGKRPGAAPPAEAWRVEATIDDESVDVHKCIPALVDSVIEYMGANTGGPQKVVVSLEP